MGGMRKFDLCIPNLEVESSFLTALAPIYAGLDRSRSSNFQFAAAEAILAGDVDGKGGRVQASLETKDLRVVIAKGV